MTERFRGRGKLPDALRPKRFRAPPSEPERPPSDEAVNLKRVLPTPTTQDPGEAMGDKDIIRQGKIYSLASGAFPTDSDAFGHFISDTGETWDGGATYYQQGVVKDGALQFGASADGLVKAGPATFSADGIAVGGKIIADANGLMADGGENILMDTTNFDGILDQSGEGGFSNVFTGANGTVRGIAIYGTGWVVWGDFTQLNGYACRYIGILSSSGGVTNIGNGLNGTVLCAVVVGTNVWFGGNFTRRDSGLAEREPGVDYQLNYLGAYNGSTVAQISHSGSIGANNVIRCMSSISGSSIVIGGDFTQLLGYSVARIGDVNTSTYVVTAMAAGLSASCYAITRSGSDILAAGAFTGTPAYIGKYSGGAWSTPGTSPPTVTLYAVILSGTDFYVGGASSTVKKLTGGAGAWADVGTPPTGTFYALAMDGSSNLYAGYDAGEYCKYYTGSAWTSLGTGMNGAAYALLLDTTMMIGGTYTTADGQVMYRLARYSPTAAPASMSLQSALDLIDDHEHYQVLFFGANVTVGALGTEYGGLGGSSGATEAEWKYTMPAGTFAEIRVRTSSTQPTNNKMTVTLRVNGADSALTVDITAGGGIDTYSDLVNTVTISANDEVTVEYTNSANATSATISGCTILFKPA